MQQSDRMSSLMADEVEIDCERVCIPDIGLAASRARYRLIAIRLTNGIIRPYDAVAVGIVGLIRTLHIHQIRLKAPR